MLTSVVSYQKGGQPSNTRVNQSALSSLPYAYFGLSCQYCKQVNILNLSNGAKKIKKILQSTTKRAYTYKEIKVRSSRPGAGHCRGRLPYSGRRLPTPPALLTWLPLYKPAAHFVLRAFFRGWVRGWGGMTLILPPNIFPHDEY